MITMGYDAMAIGNHEFDYGEEKLLWQKNRVPFPVLGANLYFKGTGYPYAQPHAVIERGGVRIGVIGVLGQDAASTAVARDHIDELDVTDPVAAVARSVAELRDDWRESLLLHHLWGFSYKEIASMLGIAEGAARLRAHRAMETLRERLSS